MKNTKIKLLLVVVILTVLAVLFLPPRYGEQNFDAFLSQHPEVKEVSGTIWETFKNRTSVTLDEYNIKLFHLEEIDSLSDELLDCCGPYINHELLSFWHLPNGYTDIDTAPYLIRQTRFGKASLWLAASIAE